MMTVAEFREYAITMHRESGKLYDGKPYETHLDMVVVNIRKNAHLLPPHIRLSDMEKAGYGHDLIEDCGLTFNDIKAVAGEVVARLILNVSDVPGEDRIERFLLTCPKTRQDLGAIYLKMNDRAANTEYSNKNGSSMSKKYKKEYGFFKYVYEPKSKIFAEMWNHLDKLVD